jgi:fructokinase
VHGKLLAHIFSDVLHTKLVQNMHGDSSGVRGAAWLFAPEEDA